MVAIKTITSYRKRALQILDDKVTSDNPTLIDYQIDDYLRNLLNLPDRPLNDLPYVGWMVEQEASDEGQMKTSKIGLQLIKKWEGFRSNSYLCPANVWTIGYGHTTTAKPNQSVTRTEAETLLRVDLFRYEQAVNNYVKVPINQNQFDALVSFTYNCGVAAFKGSTLLSLLNKGRYQSAAKQFPRWNRGGGRVLEGLSRRRQDEKRLFLTT